jgi:uncharacterized membrane protein
MKVRIKAMSPNDKQNPDTNLAQQSLGIPDQVSVTIRATTEFETGPLPSPSMLREYEIAMPGAADRIFTMAEKSQQADIDYDNTMLLHCGDSERGNRIFAQCGQVFGFVSVVLYFVVLTITVWNNNTTIFAILFSAGAVAGIGRLVRSFQEKGKEKK